MVVPYSQEKNPLSHERPNVLCCERLTIIFPLCLKHCTFHNTLVIAYRAENLYCTMVGIGIMAQIAWQVFCNIAVVTNTLPNTGISLPFFSSGGTSLILLLAEMGVMVNIGRNGERAAQQREAMRAQHEAAKAEREADRASRTIDLDAARRAREV